MYKIDLENNSSLPIPPLPPSPIFSLCNSPAAPVPKVGLLQPQVLERTGYLQPLLSGYQWHPQTPPPGEAPPPLALPPVLQLQPPVTALTVTFHPLVNEPVQQRPAVVTEGGAGIRVDFKLVFAPGILGGKQKKKIITSHQILAGNLCSLRSACQLASEVPLMDFSQQPPTDVDLFQQPPKSSVIALSLCCYNNGKARHWLV